MSLRAISPLDGRYAAKTAPLQPYLSEWALFKYRILVEARWLLALSRHDGVAELRRFTDREAELLLALHRDFDDEAAGRIKAIEAETRHDVKAVEYYIRERLGGTTLRDITSWTHFALTSDDINNLAYAMMFRDAMREVWQGAAASLLAGIAALADSAAGHSMLARTHGQPATPTTLGKEMAVFLVRLRRQLSGIQDQEYLGKLNGAVGAYNAHLVAYPAMDWRRLSQSFVEGLGLSWNPLTTQIEPHDYLAELAHGLARFNTILLDFCRDMWSYIGLGYFQQLAVAGETGSSTMPHKVNPIDFENAEANLGMSNAVLGHLAGALPISRMQRDLSDSSALRNFGAGLAHGYLALRSAERGVHKVAVDRDALEADLEDAWEVLGEAVQTVLRKHQRSDAYERLKALTRGKAITRETYLEFVRALDIPPADKARLLQLSPAEYTGMAAELAKRAVIEDG